MKSGDCFLMPAPGISNRTPHLWIVLSDPIAEDQSVIIVSITTLRQGAEQTVILARGEHPFIVRESSVCYSDARIVDAGDLDQKAKMSQIQMHAACPNKTLQNVKDGILASELTPQKVQRLYETTIKKTN